MKKMRNPNYYTQPYWSIGHYNEYGRVNHERDKARIAKEKREAKKNQDNNQDKGQEM